MNQLKATALDLISNANYITEREEIMTDITLTTKQHNKIKRAVKALNDIRAEVSKDNPEIYINWYLEDNDNLNFMGGHSHSEDSGITPQYENVIAEFTLDNSGGGGW